MTQTKVPRVALLFKQLSAYHVDRCEAVARRLAGRAEVLAVEVATRSQTNSWEPSGTVKGASKLTLFPGESCDDINIGRRLWRQFAALWRCKMVCVGIGYNEPDVIVLSWLLRLCGVQVIVLSESKYDDFQRGVGFELFKALILSAYTAAIVGGLRQADYFRFLGFRKRPVLPGYDTVGLDRVRAAGGGLPAAQAFPFAQRRFVYVGRFVAKKNLLELIEGYAVYAVKAGASARRLVLAGSGPEEANIRSRAADLGVDHLLDFPGFLSADAVARLLAQSLALILPSRVEQWGLVVNEALAFGLPVIVSLPVGSRDALVRNLVNGYIFEPGSVEGLAHAMSELASNPQRWYAMSQQSHARAWMGDADRVADAVEQIFSPETVTEQNRTLEFKSVLGSSVDNRFYDP